MHYYYYYYYSKLQCQGSVYLIGHRFLSLAVVVGIIAPLSLLTPHPAGCRLFGHTVAAGGLHIPIRLSCAPLSPSGSQMDAAPT